MGFWFSGGSGDLRGLWGHSALPAWAWGSQSPRAVWSALSAEPDVMGAISEGGSTRGTGHKMHICEERICQLWEWWCCGQASRTADHVLLLFKNVD